MTGLEPATSRPPAVRATNCATPRDIINAGALVVKRFYLASMLGGLPHALTTVRANVRYPFKEYSDKNFASLQAKRALLYPTFILYKQIQDEVINI